MKIKSTDGDYAVTIASEARTNDCIFSATNNGYQWSSIFIDLKLAYLMRSALEQYINEQSTDEGVSDD